MFTDIHWGKKQNSDAHNTNCLNFIKFICTTVKKQKNIDAICFLGDWFESRPSINVSTLNYAYTGAKLLNELNIPIFFIVGNHDLYTRVHRDIHSVVMYHELQNFKVISETTLIPELGPKGTLLVPYLFHHEYGTLQEYKKIPVFMGHFEFQGFVVTGQNTIMTHGPSHTDLKKQRRIFSGHFHKRQISDNVTYIGNAFPMDFGDANDHQRGLAIYDYDNDNLTFIDWNDSPKYVKINLSQLIEDDFVMPTNTHLKCVADIDLQYDEYTKIKKLYSNKHQLKEFIIEEQPVTVYIETEDGQEIVDDIELSEQMDTNEIIISLLQSINASNIDNTKLINIYNNLEE